MMHKVLSSVIEYMVEVARFKSSLWDVAETEEHRGKGRAPKEWNVCSFVLGHEVKSRMTVRSVYAWMESYQILRNMLD